MLKIVRKSQEEIFGIFIVVWIMIQRPTKMPFAMITFLLIISASANPLKVSLQAFLLVSFSDFTYCISWTHLFSEKYSWICIFSIRKYSILLLGARTNYCRFSKPRWLWGFKQSHLQSSHYWYKYFFYCPRWYILSICDRYF